MGAREVCKLVQARATNAAMDQGSCLPVDSTDICDVSQRLEEQ